MFFERYKGSQQAQSDLTTLKNRMGSLITESNGFMNVFGANDITDNIPPDVMENAEFGMINMGNGSSFILYYRKTGIGQLLNGITISTISGLHTVIAPAVINGNDLQFVGTVGHERIHGYHRKFIGPGYNHDVSERIA